MVFVGEFIEGWTNHCRTGGSTGHQHERRIARIACLPRIRRCEDPGCVLWFLDTSRTAAPGFLASGAGMSVLVPTNGIRQV
ncbi:CGNR zinc finger domain-containing protein [Nocardia heshunensis]